MNADHTDALILLAKRFAGIEAQEAEMTSVDRLGFHIRLKTQSGMHEAPTDLASPPWSRRYAFAAIGRDS